MQTKLSYLNNNCYQFCKLEEFCTFISHTVLFSKNNFRIPLIKVLSDIFLSSQIFFRQNPFLVGQCQVFDGYFKFYKYMENIVVKVFFKKIEVVTKFQNSIEDWVFFYQVLVAGKCLGVCLIYYLGHIHYLLINDSKYMFKNVLTLTYLVCYYSSWWHRF